MEGKNEDLLPEEMAIPLIKSGNLKEIQNLIAEFEELDVNFPIHNKLKISIKTEGEQEEEKIIDHNDEEEEAKTIEDEDVSHYVEDTPFTASIRYNQLDIFDLFLSYFPNPNFRVGMQQDTPLHLIVKSKNEKILKKFLEKFSKKNEEKKDERKEEEDQSNHEKVGDGDKREDEKVVDENMNNDGDEEEIEESDDDDDEDALDLNAKNLRNESPLELAVKEYTLNIAEILLQYGARSEFFDSDGTPLTHMAAANGDTKMLDILDSLKQPLLTKENVHNRNIFHYASMHNRKEVFDFVIKRYSKIDSNLINEEDTHGDTCVSMCAHFEFWDLLKFLVNKLEGDAQHINSKDGMATIHRFARDGKKDSIEKLLGCKAKVSDTDRDNNTALHWASITGNEEVVKFLLDKKADVNAQNKDGNYALHNAALVGHSEIIKHLIAGKKVNVNAENYYKRTPLHEAATRGHVDVIDLLMKKGATVNGDDLFGFSPLQLALHAKKPEFAVELIKLGADINKCYKTFTTECEDLEQKIEEVKKLQQQPPKSTNSKPAKTQPQETVQDMNSLDEAEGDKEGFRTLVHHAISLNFVTVVEAMFNVGLDLLNKEDRKGRSPLHNAVFQKNLDMVKLISEKEGCKIDKKEAQEGFTALIIACQSECLDICKWLIETCHANVNITDFEGRIALHHSCRMKSIEIVKTLITAGSQVNKKSSSGATPLHEACRLNHFEISHFLMENRADIAVADENGSTPLHLAVQSGSVDCTLQLLERGANLVVKDKSGRIPLMTASHAVQTECGRILIKFHHQKKLATK